MDTTESTKTIAILAVCLVWLTKQTFELYKRRKNGNGFMSAEKCRADENTSMIKDLHNWHRPSKDPGTGQPRFHWYSNSKELQEELERLRFGIAELVEEMRSASSKK